MKAKDRRDQVKQWRAITELQLLEVTAPREVAAARFKEMLTQTGSNLAASMLRDVEAGRATEAAHIVGDMLHRCTTAGMEPVTLLAAWCHLQVYERQRAATHATANP